MKLGVIIYTPTQKWRGTVSASECLPLKQGNQVKVFLMAKDFECEKLHTEQLKVTEQMKFFLDQGGEILACGTCVKLRHSEGTRLCPLPTMKDLYDLTEESDKVVSF